MRVMRPPPPSHPRNIAFSSRFCAIHKTSNYIKYPGSSLCPLPCCSHHQQGEGHYCTSGRYHRRPHSPAPLPPWATYQNSDVRHRAYVSAIRHTTRVSRLAPKIPRRSYGKRRVSYCLSSVIHLQSVRRHPMSQYTSPTVFTGRRGDALGFILSSSLFILDCLHSSR